MKLKRLPVERREPFGYREPTIEERLARFKVLQARCPYDLHDIANWTEGMWIDWGFRLLAEGVPDDRSNVEGWAIFKADIYRRDKFMFAAFVAEIETTIRGLL